MITVRLWPRFDNSVIRALCTVQWWKLGYAKIPRIFRAVVLRGRKAQVVRSSNRTADTFIVE